MYELWSGVFRSSRIKNKFYESLRYIVLALIKFFKVNLKWGLLISCM